MKHHLPSFHSATAEEPENYSGTLDRNVHGCEESGHRDCIGRHVGKAHSSQQSGKWISNSPQFCLVHTSGVPSGNTRQHRAYNINQNGSCQESP